jgi:hypothetical protein
MPNDLSESLLGSPAAAAKMASWQRTVFIVTFVNYAMAHFSRKCYTNVKTDLVKAGVDKIILSQMDMSFMFTYAIGSFISGRLGDTFPQKCARRTASKSNEDPRIPAHAKVIYTPPSYLLGASHRHAHTHHLCWIRCRRCCVLPCLAQRDHRHRLDRLDAVPGHDLDL